MAAAILLALQERNPKASYTAGIRSLDELLERDRLREKDGFPRKIRIGRLIRPGRGGKERFVIVPTTVEEKFIHDRVRVPQEAGRDCRRQRHQERKARSSANSRSGPKGKGRATGAGGGEGEAPRDGVDRL